MKEMVVVEERATQCGNAALSSALRPEPVAVSTSPPCHFWPPLPVSFTCTKSHPSSCLSPPRFIENLRFNCAGWKLDYYQNKVLDPTLNCLASDHPASLDLHTCRPGVTLR
ncbi:hypothetical protein DAEQUDRAFT_490070 [Daedalea quercina L-15889]|uniref:Uncharacterized protein n=1 Tax=Daedalea quercina L-15889 TaxID=1314783 RepID=A0A165MNT6_9APHY|nr:hypothetical protein DAEQUDRAFT_490070 [Daedalea quercina L-15889]